MKDLREAKKVRNNVIARGETSGHAHIAIGEVDVLEFDGEIYLDVKGDAWIKHLLEEAFVKEEKEIWTREHHDIKLEPGVYKYIPQTEYDPFIQRVVSVKD